ncbi:MAG: primosomal protein N', partial [Bacteroidota bacterium]
HSSDNACYCCGSRQPVPTMCPACGNPQLSLQGFGTEKIEDELKVFLPDAKVARMDFDTVKGKNALGRLINDFEERRIDILVGTQMVTKGLDFDNVGIVGVLSADNLLYFPDFRATERAFQLLTQVSGRAGRKNKRGKVIIQAYNVAHPVVREVVNNDFQSFYRREIVERQQFKYPPYHRLIKVTLKHKKYQVLNDASRFFTQALQQQLGDRVIGPAVPGIPRVRNYYLMDYMIKLERNAKLIAFAKEAIQQATTFVKSQQGCSTIRVNVDVDPY